ncbi:MAG: hypothetical protein HY911_02850 [Desulfobacterales bacterium]|nr:hypothetical protein [Desulfobacterales bacterium]
MTLANSLTALCDMLQSQTKARVVLGLPDKAVPGIYVWPFQMTENQHVKNIRDHLTPHVAKAPPSSSLIVHVLVVVNPAYTDEGLALLEASRKAILDQPVMTIDGKAVRILPAPLEIAELTALFTAATIPLTICLSARMEC